MKKCYITLCALSLVAFAGQVSAQNALNTIKESKSMLLKNETVKTVSNVSGNRGAEEVYFSEDFSNGFDGQGSNGAWTTDGPQGELWFQSFPLGMTNGYNPDAPLTGPAAAVYGEFIPNFYGTGVIESLTPDNGFMMMDADRWNSIATDPLNTGVDFLTENEINSSLVSPSINLSAAAGTSVVMTFAQDFRACCTDYGLNMDVSIDGGATWVPYDYWALSGATGNTNIVGTGSIDISNVTLGASAADLMDFRFRFRWFDNGGSPDVGDGPTHYYIQLDDINIKAAPANELVILGTYLNNYFDYPGDDEDTEFVKRFAYWNQPQYITRPFNFAAGVSNNGSNAQTNVKLEVTLTSPGGSVETFFSGDDFTLESGESDTLRILDVIPNSWVYPAATGVYSCAFRIIQDEEDELLGNNIGTTRTTRISIDDSEPAIFQNDRNAISNLPLAADAQDAIHGNRFVFTEPEIANKMITHIEFVLLNSGTSITQEGELIYLNVRNGSVYEPEGPDNQIVRLFEDDEIEFIIEAGNISTGGTPVWNSVELPTPLLITPDLIYQGEVEIPAAGGPIAYVALSNDNESGASVVMNFSDMVWGSYANIATMIRFRTDGTLSANNVSYENGIKLTQNYPNPFTDNTMIQYQMDETSAARIEVYDLAGKMVFSKSLGQAVALVANIYTFERGDLAAGTYTYSIITDKERVTRKMTIE